MKIFFNIAILILMIVPLTSNAQLQSYSFEQVDSLQNSEPRNTVVFIYTDWCKFCHVMQATTFEDETCVQLLNAHFWFVAFNAEETRTITYKEHSFHFKPSGNKTGMHELVEELATINGEVSFPSLCVLNQHDEIIFQSNQFLTTEELEVVLNQVLKSQN